MKKARMVSWIVFGVMFAAGLICFFWSTHAEKKGDRETAQLAMSGLVFFGTGAIMAISACLAIQKVLDFAPDAEHHQDPAQARLYGIVGCIVSLLAGIVGLVISIVFMAEIFVMLSLMTLTWSACFGFVWYHARRY